MGQCCVVPLPECSLQCWHVYQSSCLAGMASAFGLRKGFDPYRGPPNNNRGVFFEDDNAGFDYNNKFVGGRFSADRGMAIAQKRLQPKSVLQSRPALTSS